jgi:hypothetical protein
MRNTDLVNSILKKDYNSISTLSNNVNADILSNVLVLLIKEDIDKEHCKCIDFLLKICLNNNISFNYSSPFIPLLFLHLNDEKLNLFNFIIHSYFFDLSYDDNEILNYIIYEKNYKYRKFVFDFLINRKEIDPIKTTYCINMIIKLFQEFPSEENEYILNLLFQHKSLNFKKMLEIDLFSTIFKHQSISAFKLLLSNNNDIELSFNNNEIYKLLIKSKLSVDKDFIRIFLRDKNFLKTIKTEKLLYIALLNDDEFQNLIYNFQKIESF